MDWEYLMPFGVILGVIVLIVVGARFFWTRSVKGGPIDNVARQVDLLRRYAYARHELEYSEDQLTWMADLLSRDYLLSVVLGDEKGDRYLAAQVLATRKNAEDVAVLCETLDRMPDPEYYDWGMERGGEVSMIYRLEALRYFEPAFRAVKLVFAIAHHHPSHRMSKAAAGTLETWKVKHREFIEKVILDRK